MGSHVSDHDVEYYDDWTACKKIRLNCKFMWRQLWSGCNYVWYYTHL